MTGRSTTLRALLGVAVALALAASACAGDDSGADEANEESGDAANSGTGPDDTSGDTGEAAGEQGWHGGLVNDPQPRPTFTLTDTEGEPYNFEQETAGELTLLFFGYTHCPDICPVQMATLASALENTDIPRPKVVFVTTDPERDTPERLRQWLDNFGTDFVGLTGTLEEIHQAEQATGIDASFFTEDGTTPVSEPPGNSENYEVGHAAQVIAYTPDDLTHIVYPFGVQRDHWVSDIPRLADGWEPQPTGD